jgi:hypothetical protein
MNPNLKKGKVKKNKNSEHKIFKFNNIKNKRKGHFHFLTTTVHS